MTYVVSWYVKSMPEMASVLIVQLAEALRPFAALGGPEDGFPAFQDLEDDVVVYGNSGRFVTAGDVRRARDLLQTMESFHEGLT